MQKSPRAHACVTSSVRAGTFGGGNGIDAWLGGEKQQDVVLNSDALFTGRGPFPAGAPTVLSRRCLRSVRAPGRRGRIPGGVTWGTLATRHVWFLNLYLNCA